MNKLLSIFKIPELARKLWITIALLAIYRIGLYIPLPIIDQAKMQSSMQQAQSGALGQIMGYVSLFSGGTLSQSSIFGMGIMPYISASIIFQLLSSVVPSLERIRKEGESGRKKINQWTRIATVPICMIQTMIWIRHLMGEETPESGGLGLALGDYATGFNYYYYAFSCVLTMTAGTMFLMWIGEQIDEYGIGNGISLIIMAGIISRIPDATGSLLIDPSTGWLRESIFTLGGGGGQDVSFEKILALIILFIAVVVAVIAITKATRHITTQSAKHVRGRRVFGGTKQSLPLRVNAGGVMPVIFASSLLLLPWFLFKVLSSWSDSQWITSVANAFERQGYIYNLCYIALIYFFCYFWVAITFNPKEVADNLKDYGSFIPGYRPGKRTADYLEKVLQRITYVGAAFLAIVAIIPSLVSAFLDVDYRIAQFYGGTGLLIVVSVALDLVQRINSHLVMRNYPGLTED
jgi:preprotein translocase subunit SecY